MADGTDASRGNSSEPINTAAGETLPQRIWGGFQAIGVTSIFFSILLGLLSGLGVFTFGYGKGASYLSSDPQGCRNCHVMHDHFDAWQHSSHHHVAVCNDCHLPHDHVGKLVTKADNGFFHSLAFTMQNYHEPIQIKPRNSRVTQNTCLDCHQNTVHSLLPPPVEEKNDVPGQLVLGKHETLSCVHCHADVGHAHK